jgi:hypothetical protein
MSAENVEIAKRLTDAYNRRDVDTVFAELATPDQVLLLGRLKGRGKGSGAPVDQPYAAIFDFRGDRTWRSGRTLIAPKPSKSWGWSSSGHLPVFGVRPRSENTRHECFVM